MKMRSLLSIPPETWEEVVVEMGAPAYRARQLRHWVFGECETDFSHMTDLPAAFAVRMKENFSILDVHPAQEAVSEDGTVKWALEAADGKLFESVLIPDGDRRSLCVSSQVGCAMGCRFCATASMGFTRNLTTGEILGQVLHAARHLRRNQDGDISNIVFMGMGEPLQNMENVLAACQVLTGREGFAMAPRRVTVSTCGLVPKMREWMERAPGVGLAVSLNGADDAVRGDLMPVNRTHPLADLLRASDDYIRATGRELTYEYILIRGRTCTPVMARNLRRIASERHCKVNLIAYNCGGDPDLEAPTAEEVREFVEAASSGGYPLTLRKTRGRDIAAACGQLVQQPRKVA